MRDRKIDGLQILVCVKDNVALLFEKLNVPQKIREIYMCNYAYNVVLFNK